MIDMIRYRDPELEALRHEIQDLERRVRDRAREKIRMLEAMEDFCRRQYQELGTLTIRLLEKTLARLSEALQESPEDLAIKAQVEKTAAQLDSFRREAATGKHFTLLLPDLSEEEEEELKKTFRSALRLCHPDAAPPGLKERAETITRALVSAYRARNLLAVYDIFLQLTCEGLSGTHVVIEGAHGLLTHRRDTLLRRLQQEHDVIAELTESKSYRTATQIPDWDVYFAAARESLEQKLAAEEPTA